MAPQNEMHKESRDEDIESADGNARTVSDKGADLESRNIEPEPFSNDDPFLATRIAETRSQTNALFESLSLKTAGFENATNEQYRRISEDAIERAKWPEAIQDEFEGLLRLGRKIPPRSRRIL